MVGDDGDGHRPGRTGSTPADGRTDRAPGTRRRRGQISGVARQRLGVHLRAMYESVVQEPVPDRFRLLVAGLDADEPAGASVVSRTDGAA